MKRKTQILFWTGAGCLMLWLITSPPDAHAYGYQIKKSNNTKIIWPVNSIQWRGGKKSFPAGSLWRESLLQANAIWNQTPANFTFSAAWGDTSLRRGNGQNEAWFSGEWSVLKGAPAICCRWKVSTIDRFWWSEADIIFDAAEPWTPYSYPTNLWSYGGQYRPFVTTALHEMGHALGLNHENRFYNIMGEDWTHVHTDQYKATGYAGSDAAQGALFLYGQPAKYGWKDDVAVTHWKYAGKDGEYSTHTPTVMYYVDVSARVNFVQQDGSALYLVKPGFSYLAEFTYENTGWNNQPNTKVAWFISTNKAISTFDRMIGSTQINLPAAAVWTTTVQLTIPADLKIGMVYYLGVIVDYQNNIGEFNEVNNSSFLQIKTITPI